MKISEYESGPIRVRDGVLFSYWNPEANSVHIAGDFNGWDSVSHPMHRDVHGWWSATLPLEAGLHQYKFIVDNSWVLDPANPCCIDNTLGGWNSFLEIAADGEVHLEAPAEGMSAYSRFEAVDSPAWVNDAVIYEIFPRVFSQDGTLEAIRARLPELASLGVNCIWLMPIHRIGTVGRKGILGSPYAIYDYYSIDPGYGTAADLRALVQTAHANGMRVIMDMVANHTANDCPLTKEHPDWYSRDGYGVIRSPGFGWDDVAQLDYGSSELRDYMVEVMRYWVREFNIDGYRCDVAALVPLDFWKRVRAELREIKQDIMLLAESHEPAHNLHAFDLTYEESLPALLSDVIRGVSPARSIREMLERQRLEFPRNSLRLRYLENHDQMRIQARLGDESGDEHAGRGGRLAAVLLLTLDGVPLIYNGQEIGERERPDLFDPFKIRWDRGDHELRGFYRDLLSIRRASPALRRGDLKFIDIEYDDKCLAYVRQYTGNKGNEVGNEAGSAVLVALNFSGDRISFTVDLSGAVSEVFLNTGAYKLGTVLEPFSSQIIDLGAAFTLNKVS
ncbi:MAG: DUF3459 domain-containing protein [Firmicutes bacterium]|nr:DUF3459 domain-containing protein [Bacillota bacterium]